MDEAQRWVPSFSVFFDALGQKAEGSVTSGNVLGPPLPEGCSGQPPPPGRLCDQSATKFSPDDEGGDTDVATLVGGSLELMTPRLFEPLLQPRLFVHGDAASAFSFERNLAGRGSPGPFAVPELDLNDRNIPEPSISGQGSRTKMQVKRLVLSGGGGLAFTVDLFQRRFRIKPSIEYLREEIDLIASVRRAVKLFDSVDPQAGQGLERFRLVSLSSIDQKTYQGIGPGLEIEADTLRAGPFLLSVYIAGRGYHLWGDLDVTTTVSNEFGETATWTWKKDSWAWRGGVGLRFRLIPE